jgi:microcystin-dependent protein
MFAHRSYNVAPDIIDAGQGSGGGGNIVNNNLPLGVVVPYAGVISGSAPYLVPTNWLVCDGTEYRNDTIYEGLYNVIGFAFGVAPSSTVQTGIGAYSYGATANTITLNATTANLFIKAGTIVRPTGFVLTTGEDINATYVLVSSAPAIGGTGTITGTFVQPITGTGSGNASGTYSVNRASFATPNMVSKFPLGAPTGGGSPVNASTGGSATTTITADNLPQHNHGIDNGLGYSASGLGNGASSNFIRTNFTITRTLASQTYLNDNTTLATNSAINTLNPYLALYYIIHAKN